MGARKRGQEAVVFELDHLAVMMGYELPHEHVVIAQQSLPALLAELVGGGTRVGDVAQHQRDRSVGRAVAAEIRYHRVERRSDYVDRSELCSESTSPPYAPPPLGASIP